jgi:hypothetical protein
MIRIGTRSTTSYVFRLDLVSNHPYNQPDPDPDPDLATILCAKEHMSHITDFHVGYEFVPVRFQLNPEEVALYLQAVGESNALFCQQNFVPLTALAAYGLRGILIEIGLPPGAIHSAQATSVFRATTSDETIVFSAKLTQNAVWKDWRFVTVHYTGVDEDEKQVLQGRSTVVIPEDHRGNTGQ